MQSFVIEVHFDDPDHPKILQGENPFAGRDLDPRTMHCLADWFVRVGRRMGHIPPQATLRTPPPGEAGREMV